MSDPLGRELGGVGGRGPTGPEVSRSQAPARRLRAAKPYGKYRKNFSLEKTHESSKKLSKKLMILEKTHKTPENNRKNPKPRKNS